MTELARNEVYSEECNCQWCANLDAKPCVVIERLEQRVAALEYRLNGGE